MKKFQAFIDDSKGPAGEYILAGYIASIEAWPHFCKEWEALLPFGTRREDDAWHFKMSEMALTEDRLARVSAFYRIIEKYVTVAISARLNIAEFERGRDRAIAWARDVNIALSIGKWENPYFSVFRGLINIFQNNRDKFPSLPIDSRVDFVFDDQTEKTIILGSWDDYMSKLDQSDREKYGSVPKFEDDLTCLPLQAADLWAWWVREWYEEDDDDVPARLHSLDFRYWKSNVRIPRIAINIREQNVYEFICGMLLEGMASGDLKDQY